MYISGKILSVKKLNILTFSAILKSVTISNLKRDLNLLILGPLDFVVRQPDTVGAKVVVETVKQLKCNAVGVLVRNFKRYSE